MQGKMTAIKAVGSSGPILSPIQTALENAWMAALDQAPIGVLA